MSVVVSDVVDGSSISQDAESGYSGVRQFIVSGLTGVAAGKMLAALEATGIPAIFDVWPGMTMQCHAKTAVPINTESTQFRVTCNYKFLQEPGPGGGAGTEPATLTLSSTVQSVQTTKKLGAAPGFTPADIILGDATGTGTFDWPASDETGAAITRKLMNQTGMVNVQIPQTSFSFSRRESQDAIVNAQTYVGKVNSDIFFGCAVETVLCTRIESTSNDNGETFTTAYEFQYDPIGWKADVVYIDQDTGMPLLGADIGVHNTKDAVRIYQSVAFAGLNIHIPTYP